MSQALATIEPSPRYHRDYSAEFKAEVIAAVKSNDGNVYRTAQEYELDTSLVQSWMRQSERYANLTQLKSVELANKCEAGAHRTVDAMMDQDLTEVSYVQKATALGILTDKMLLLRGQPTSIIASSNNDLSELLSSVQAIAQEQRLSEHEAALRLAAQLADVPELAAMLREWAEGEQARRSLVQPDVATTTPTSHKG